jgi:hypothetical protein
MKGRHTSVIIGIAAVVVALMFLCHSTMSLRVLLITFSKLPIFEVFPLQFFEFLIQLYLLVLSLFFFQ